MAISDEQRHARKGFLGASEVPAICGLDPYRSAADVWAMKKGLLADFSGSEAATRGNVLEPALLQWASDRLGLTFDRDVMVIDDAGLIAANFDGYGESFGMEAKTSKMTLGWGDDGSSDVPDRVAVQCQSQMRAAGPQMVRVYVPALIAMDLRLYVVERDNDAIDAIVERCRAFKDSLAGDDVPDGGMSVDVLRCIRRVPGTVARIDAGVVSQWREAKQQVKAATEKEEQLYARVLQDFGDCEGAAAVDAEGREVATLTYFEQSREGVDLDRLRKEFPEAAAACMKTSRFRVLRHKELKGLVRA